MFPGHWIQVEIDHFDWTKGRKCIAKLLLSDLIKNRANENFERDLMYAQLVSNRTKATSYLQILMGIK